MASFGDEFHRDEPITFLNLKCCMRKRKRCFGPRVGNGTPGDTYAKRAFYPLSPSPSLILNMYLHAYVYVHIDVIYISFYFLCRGICLHVCLCATLRAGPVAARRHWVAWS